MRSPRVLVAIGFALGLACRHAPVGEDRAEAPLPDGELTIKVVNHGRLDVTIYVVHGSTRDRLGASTASLTTSFKFSIRRLGAGREYYLLGDPIGSSRTARTETLIAEDGELVTWTLEDDLRRSSVEVR